MTPRHLRRAGTTTLTDERGVVRRPIVVAALAVAIGAVTAFRVWGAVAVPLGVSAGIAIHEAAHLVATLACRGRIVRYYIGFGPRLWSRQVRGVEVSFRLFFVLGGAVELDPAYESEMRNRSRILIAFAGPVSNMLLGWGLLFGTQVVAADRPSGIAAAEATAVTTDLLASTAQTFTRLPDLVAGAVRSAATGDEPAVEDRLMSPVSMAQIGQQASELGGAAMVIRVIAVINLALGFMNLLPIPPLDGSLIVTSVVRGVTSRVGVRRVLVPDALFKGVAIAFTAVMVVALAATAVVDLVHPVHL